MLGAIYLEFKRDFSRTHDWLVNGFIAEAVDNLLTDYQMFKKQLSEEV